MKRIFKAPAVLLALQLLGAPLAPANAYESITFQKESSSKFMLPINGYVQNKPLISMNAPDAIPPVSTINTITTESKGPSKGPIMIDNDADNTSACVDTYQWKEIPDEAGRTKIEAGAQFPVSIRSEITSKTAKVGDPVEARLTVDIKIGGRVVAPKGSKVIGHVRTVYHARKLLHAELCKNRWMRANGAIGIQFDEIITDKGEHLPVIAKPAKHARIVKNTSEGRILGINDNGEVASPLSIQLKHQAAHLAIRTAASAAGVFSFGAVPVAYGLIGAINPSFAFMHPVGQNVPHRRLKGFAMGVVTGLPGGSLIADSIISGQEAVIKPGDEFLAEFKQDFTGEASTGAELLPNAQTKVRGEVLPQTTSGK